MKSFTSDIVKILALEKLLNELCIRYLQLITCIHLHSSENQVTGKTLLAANLVGKGYNYMITPLVCKKKLTNLL